MPKVYAEKSLVILLKNQSGSVVGVVIRNGHWIFHSVEEMGDDDICELFEKKDHA